MAGADSTDPLAIGVDIGATAIKAALVGIDGDLLESFREPSPRTTSALHDFVHSVLKCAKVPVQGVGIGCKGIIDPGSSRVKSLPGNLNFLEGHRLSEVIAAGDMPICAENDARTALIAEVLWGAARGRRNVVMLTLGTAVGPLLIAPIQDKIRRRTKIMLGREVPIVFQKIIGFGGVAGAAGLVFLQQHLLAI
jgi:glucokinase